MITWISIRDVFVHTNVFVPVNPEVQSSSESVLSGEQTLTWPDFSLLMKAGATKDRPENTHTHT